MGNQPAAFQLHINHKLIPNVSQKVVVSFIYIQRKDGVYFMSTKTTYISSRKCIACGGGSWV